MRNWHRNERQNYCLKWRHCHCWKFLTVFLVVFIKLFIFCWNNRKSFWSIPAKMQQRTERNAHFKIRFVNCKKLDLNLKPKEKHFFSLLEIHFCCFCENRQNMSFSVARNSSKKICYIFFRLILLRLNTQCIKHAREQNSFSIVVRNESAVMRTFAH